MSSLKKQIVKDTLVYTFANYVAMAIGIFVSVVTKAILGTVGAGYWAILKVFTSYGEYSDLGTRNAMIREIPRVIGAGKEIEARKTEDSAFAFTILAAMFSAVVIFLVAQGTRDPLLKQGLWICTGLVIATQLYNFSLTALRTFKKVGSLSAVIVLNMIFVGAFSIAGVVWKGVLGMAAGVTLATSASACAAYIFGRMRFRFAWNSAEILRLVKIGFPMVIISYALVTFLSLDTLMIAKMIGIRAAGFYTIGLMSVQQVGALARFSQIILLPHIQERYGQSGSLPETAAIMIRATRVLAHLVPLMIALVIFFVPVVVHYFLPKFTGGITSMKWLVMGYYFVAVNELSANAAFTADKQKQLIPFLGALIAVAAALNFFFIRFGFGIEGVAAATSLSYFLCFVVVFSFAFSRLVPFSEVRAVVLEVIGLFGYFSLCIWAAEFFEAASAPILWKACLKFAAFSVLFFPALLRIEKDERICGVLKNLLLKRVAAS